MLPFDYIGRDWREKNRVRRICLQLLLLVCAILLFPFILLGLCLWGLWRLANPGRESNLTGISSRQETPPLVNSGR